jgi:hypothetical protein
MMVRLTLASLFIAGAASAWTPQAPPAVKARSLLASPMSGQTTINSIARRVTASMARARAKTAGERGDVINAVTSRSILVSARWRFARSRRVRDALRLRVAVRPVTRADVSTLQHRLA